MKKLIQTKFRKFSIIAVALLAIGMTIQTSAQVRTESAPQKIMPKVPFNEPAARNQLEPGNATINGKACGRFNRRSVAASNITVHLYPDSPYIREWVKLGWKNSWYGVGMVDAAFDTRIDALTDDAGRFTFTKIKPGKYYVQGYSKFSLSYSDGDRDELGKVLDAFIEIKNDNDVKSLDISNQIQKRGLLGEYSFRC